MFLKYYIIQEGPSRIGLGSAFNQYGSCQKGQIFHSEIKTISRCYVFDNTNTPNLYITFQPNS